MERDTLMEKRKVIVQIKNVNKLYGDNHVVHSLNMDIYEGEFLTMLGPSGCGKSTLLRIIAGLQKATQGKVLYRGQQLEGVNPHTSIIFQTFALFPWLTVLENVSLALKAKGVEKHERDKKAEDLLDRVGLDGF